MIFTFFFSLRTLPNFASHSDRNQAGFVASVCLSSKFHLLPVSLLLRRQSETVYRNGERDGQRGEVSGRSQPKVSGQLPRLAPALQPKSQNQQLPALPPRYGPAPPSSAPSLLLFMSVWPLIVCFGAQGSTATAVTA